MTDAGVFHAAARFRIAEEMARVLHRRLQHHAMRVAASASDQEAHRVHQGQGAARNRGQFFAFLHFFPIAHIGATDVLRLVQHHLVDAVALFVGVFVLDDFLVLAGVACRLAFMARARAQGAGNQFTALVVVAGLHVLQHQAARELAFLFLHAHHAFDRGDAVTGAHMAEQLPVVAGVKAMDAGQAPAGAAQPAEGHGEHGMAKHRAVARAGAVADVSIQRIEVADAVAPVAQGVRGGVLQIRSFGPKMQADHCAGGGDGLVRDAALGGRVSDIGLGKTRDIAHF
ncbi:hypothetical protein D3C86_688910 [compost metagenome]